MSARWARKRALPDACDISELPSRKVHPHSVHYQLLTLIVAISSPFSLHHNLSFPKTSSSTATEHGHTDSSVRSLLVPVSLSTPLRWHCQQCPRRPPCIYLLETFISRTRVLNILSTLYISYFLFLYVLPSSCGPRSCALPSPTTLAPSHRIHSLMFLHNFPFLPIFGLAFHTTSCPC